jgi:hypothetical protein
LEITEGSIASGSADKADFYFIGVCSSISDSVEGISAVVSNCGISEDLS